MYDPLSTAGKIISRGSRGSTEGEEGSKGAVQRDAINWVASKLSQHKIVATSGETLPAIVTDMNNS